MDIKKVLMGEKMPDKNDPPVSRAIRARGESRAKVR